MSKSLEVLQPYFKLRKLTGTTFYRSDRRPGTAVPLVAH